MQYPPILPCWSRANAVSNKVDKTNYRYHNDLACRPRLLIYDRTLTPYVFPYLGVYASSYFLFLKFIQLCIKYIKPALCWVFCFFGKDVV